MGVPPCGLRGEDEFGDLRRRQPDLFAARKRRRIVAFLRAIRAEIRVASAFQHGFSD